MKKLLQTIFGTFLVQIILAQNVGIGTTTPTRKLEVVGDIHTTTNLFVDGYIGVGSTTLPSYKVQITNGSLALYNSADNIYWSMNYSSSANLFYFSNGPNISLAMDNTNRVSIGSYPPNATLDVYGNAKVQTDMAVGGNVTVNNGRGILQNTAGATQLKYYTRTAAFGAILGGNALSVEGSIAFASGIFTSPPQVMVGDIVSTGGTVGELYRVQLIIYDVTATGCHARLLNTSPNAVNYGITWNIICIGN